MMQQVSKDNARYSGDGSATEHCSLCEHFEKPNECEKVKGRVSPGGWCRFFRKHAA